MQNGVESSVLFQKVSIAICLLACFFGEYIVVVVVEWNSVRQSGQADNGQHLRQGTFINNTHSQS